MATDTLIEAGVQPRERHRHRASGRPARTTRTATATVAAPSAHTADANRWPAEAREPRDEWAVAVRVPYVPGWAYAVMIGVYLLVFVAGLALGMGIQIAN